MHLDNYPGVQLDSTSLLSSRTYTIPVQGVPDRAKQYGTKLYRPELAVVTLVCERGQTAWKIGHAFIYGAWVLKDGTVNRYVNPVVDDFYPSAFVGGYTKVPGWLVEAAWALADRDNAADFGLPPVRHRDRNSVPESVDQFAIRKHVRQIHDLRAASPDRPID